MDELIPGEMILSPDEVAICVEVFRAKHRTFHEDDLLRRLEDATQVWKLEQDRQRRARTKYHTGSGFAA